MAVKKASLEARYQQYFKLAEEHIDSVLKDNFRPGVEVKVEEHNLIEAIRRQLDTPPPSDVRGAIAEYIVKVYTEAGWSAKYDKDQYSNRGTFRFS